MYAHHFHLASLTYFYRTVHLPHVILIYYVLNMLNIQYSPPLLAPAPGHCIDVMMWETQSEMSPDSHHTFKLYFRNGNRFENRSN